MDFLPAVSSADSMGLSLLLVQFRFQNIRKALYGLYKGFFERNEPIFNIFGDSIKELYGLFTSHPFMAFTLLGNGR